LKEKERMTKMCKNLQFNFESLKCDNNEVRMVYKLMLAKESNQPPCVQTVTKPRDVFELAKSYLTGVDREHFVILILDVKNKVIGINTVAIGTLSYCSVHPREVFKAAVVANAALIIMIHNHPSGNPHPSSDDLALTARLKEAGDILGIPVVDHIVLGDENYYSLKEAGNL
jgi:DNA repair protein RadC